MKKVCAFLIGCLCFASYAGATNYVWVGPVGGKYSDPANWSLSGVAGTGGAGVPGPGDAVSFSFFATGLRTFLINLDASPTVNNFSIGTACDVTLVTSINTTFTVTNQFTMNGSLLDSTSEDVKFNFVFDHATANVTSSTGALSWSFSGRVPVSNGNGAIFTAAAGSSVTVGNTCNIVSKNNSGYIVSTPATLTFNAGSGYVLDNNLDGATPYATWALAQGTEIPPSNPYVAAPVIQINGDARTVRHSINTKYGSIYVNLNNLSADASLALPNGTTLSQYLSVSNTNNHTLTLLDAAGASFDSVTLLVSNNGTGGSFTLSGSTTKVALAKAPGSAPGTTYKLDLWDFNQTGGNFSLQDADNYTGSSVLSIRRDLYETGGTFVTNSAAASAPARFAVEFLGPSFFSRPSGPQFTGHRFNVSSGSINSPANMVTFRMAEVPFTYVYTIPQTSPIGTTLSTPLQVGRLELNGGPIFTSTANLLTVLNPSSDAVQITTNNSYVNGPVRRATNSANAYMLPAGKGTQYIFNLDTSVIIPSSSTPSIYQAEYFNTRYADTSVTAPFKGVDTSRYWDISKVSGSDAQVRLILTSAVPSASSTDNLIVAHYTGGKWISEQGTILSPGNIATGSVTSKVLSAFSPFTFGYGSFINAPLAVHLISFDGHQENGGTMLNWKTASAASRFEVLRATDGINFSSIGTIAALSMQRQYTFFDNKPQPGKNFYRLRSVEKDGAVSLSDVLMITSAGSITELLTLAPTIVTGNASLRINALKDGTMGLMVTDMAGRTWKKLALSVRAGSSSNTLNLSDLPAGTYQIGGYMDGKKTAVIRFIKQ